MKPSTRRRLWNIVDEIWYGYGPLVVLVELLLVCTWLLTR